MDLLPEAKVVGLTATPVSSAQNHPLKKYYQAIVNPVEMAELLQRGFLVPAIEIGHENIITLSTENGEFSSLSQIAQFKKYNLRDKMLEIWLRSAKSRKTIVYNINVDHNTEIYNAFVENGISCEALTGETSKDERKRIVSAYERGLIQVACNVGILTKGLDSPSTSCIVLNRATASLSLCRQMMGRGGRPFWYTETRQKENFILIDMGNNIARHGSYDDAIDWEELFRNESRDKNFKVKVTLYVCPTCYSYTKNRHIEYCGMCKTIFADKPLLTMKDASPPYTPSKPLEQMTLKELSYHGKMMGYDGRWAWNYRFGRLNKKMSFKHSTFRP
jgi:superfamily II DNA or RNA helicase